MKYINTHFFKYLFLFSLVAASVSCGGTDSVIDNEPSPPAVTPPKVDVEMAFPGAQGYGKMTTGGRGGKVLKVTKLTDDGSVGTLRWAVNQTGSRIIVFDVDGNIELTSTLPIKNGDVTIAGQSAPGDGICIKNYSVTIGADNVIIRYIRFRMGDEKKTEDDALWGRNIKNIMIDHCSLSWATDETSSFYHTQNFTMQYCILSESLTNSVHGKGAHGYGGIWGGNKVSFHHNLLAHHSNRTPRFDGGLRIGTGSGTGASPFGPDYLDYRNNVIYNWTSYGSYGGENGQYNMVGNYYKPGPATTSSTSKSRILQVSKETSTDPTYLQPGYGKFYITGNTLTTNSTTTANNWNGVRFDSGITQAMAQLTNPLSVEVNFEITNETAEAAYTKVLAIAGASYKRDAVDKRVVEEVANGTFTYTGSNGSTNGLIDSQTDVGGWPTLAAGTPKLDTDGDGMPDEWETKNGLNPKVADANGKNLSTVYNNIEVYLNELVKSITDQQ